MAGPPIMATFTGFVATTVDAALLVQAAIAGRLPHVATRPDSVRYRQLARSGTVVVFGPGIRRWREGLSWTPRRALGNGFDVYRETTATGLRLSDTDKVSKHFSISITPVSPNPPSRLPLDVKASSPSSCLHQEHRAPFTFKSLFYTTKRATADIFN